MGAYYSFFIRGLPFGVCVSGVIEKSLADSRKAGRPINPFMIMTKLLSKVRF